MQATRAHCLRAVRSKDARFDGWFYTAVVTTRIYCRPSCPATPPKDQNMLFYSTAAAAQQAGYRACKRCRPDASPGSPEWNHRADLVARTMRLIADGVVDRDGVRGLAGRLGYSVRQVQRQLLAELGTGPIALARAQRAQTARLLLETSTLPMGEIAFAAGFASVRSFNETIQAVFARSPSELRARITASTTVKTDGVGPAGKTGTTSTPSKGVASPAGVTAGTLSVRLPFRQPFHAGSVFDSLAEAAVAGVEEWLDGAYRRTLRLPHGPGLVSLRPTPDYIECKLTLRDLRDLSTAISRCRWLLDLDADPVAIDELLCRDKALSPLILADPGRRVARTVDGAELAVRTLLDKQASRASDQTSSTRHSSARITASQMAKAHGEPVTDPFGSLTHLFPTPEILVALPSNELCGDPVSAASMRSLLYELIHGGVDLSAGGDWQRAHTRLSELPGMDPLTVETITMRALGDPDAFRTTDPSLLATTERLGLPNTAAGLSSRAEAWRPWRAYAEQYLSGGRLAPRMGS